LHSDIFELQNYTLYAPKKNIYSLISFQKKIFNTDVLNKYKVDYFQCLNCNFIQTEKPYWLDEAYSDAITKLDIGIIYRNINFSNTITQFFKNNLFSSDGIYLDYGGGYGIFVRMMRDKGFNFYRQDVFCNNLFAKNLQPLIDSTVTIKVKGVTCSNDLKTLGLAPETNNTPLSSACAGTLFFTEFAFQNTNWGIVYLAFLYCSRIDSKLVLPF
jgi:hypothetical protein